MDFSDFLKKEEEKNKPKEEEKIRFVGRKRNFVNKKDLPMVVTFNREFDFLKYFYVVEYWAMSQYKINRDDLAMLLFLYSEDYFDIKLFNKYSFVLISKKQKKNYKLSLTYRFEIMSNITQNMSHFYFSLLCHFLIFN
jgi:hypothetical protein